MTEQLQKKPILKQVKDTNNHFVKAKTQMCNEHIKDAAYRQGKCDSKPQ